jgi:hypothetical protein
VLEFAGDCVGAIEPAEGAVKSQDAEERYDAGPGGGRDETADDGD